VSAAQRQLGGEIIPTSLANEYWLQLREHTAKFFAHPNHGLPLWRLSVAPTAPVLAIPGDQLIEWHGALRWLRSPASADQLRTTAAAAGGHATLFRGGDGSIEAFTRPTPALLQLHARLKHSFDPHGIFNRGRLYREL
jgi:glycolate oxidase FAD binding subunit